MALAASLTVAAIDLPIKTINGTPYYYYVVKKGDTIYSLIKKLGITRAQLVEANPGAADILRQGDTLYFPVEEDQTRQVEFDRPVASAGTQNKFIVYHKVNKGETLYGISRQYDVDVEQIVALNPGVRLGVKAGTTLKIPKKDNEMPQEYAAGPIEAENIVPVAPDTVATAEQSSPLETEETSDIEDETSDYAEAIGPSSIVVALPFMLEADEPSRQAQLYTDFYKGMLIAADSLSLRGDTVRIYAYDTADDIERIKDILSDSIVTEASVIIAPDNDAQMSLILNSVDPKSTKVLSVFGVRDSSYISNAASVQTNIPHRYMYAKALEAIDRLYSDYTPLILRNESGRNDKSEFIDALVEHSRANGIEPLTLAYDGALLISQLEPYMAEGKRYIIVPSSGSLAEFNKFSHALNNVRNNYPAGDFVLFGYPDWTAFRNDAEQMLHNLDATVYSRFYFDTDGFDTKCFNDAFRRWYGELPHEVVPNQGLLGFDLGNLLIRNIRNNDGYFNPLDDRYAGAQSTFKFSQISAPDGEPAGCYNDDIYILRFRTDGRVERLLQ